MRAAIVGFGRIAHGRTAQGLLPLTHLDAYRARRGRISLVAIADIDDANRELAKRLIPGIRVYEEMEEMLGRERPDVVSICTPDGLHARQMMDVAGRGVRAIWCEKPVATDLEQVRLLESVVNDFPPVQVNFWRRFVPEIGRLRDRIRAHGYGRVNRMSGYYPGGWLRNGSHLIDLLSYFGGEVNIGCRQDVRVGNELDILAAGATAGGASWTAIPVPRDRYNIFELDILCQQARLRIAENGRAIETFRDRKDPEFRHLRILQSQSRRVACKWKRAFHVALDNLIDCAEGKVMDTISPLRNALSVARTMIDVPPKPQS